MPSCRHSYRDSKEQVLTCGNNECDGKVEGTGCRHNEPQKPATTVRWGEAGTAVTGKCCAGEAGWVEISSPVDGITVRLPAVLPVMTPRVGRLLLGILVDLAEVPVADKPGEEVSDDR